MGIQLCPKCKSMMIYYMYFVDDKKQVYGWKCKNCGNNVRNVDISSVLKNKKGNEEMKNEM